MEAAKVDGEEERVEEDGGLRGSAAGDGTRARDSAGRLNRVIGASSPAVGSWWGGSESGHSTSWRVVHNHHRPASNRAPCASSNALFSYLESSTGCSLFLAVTEQLLRVQCKTRLRSSGSGSGEEGRCWMNWCVQISHEL